MCSHPLKAPSASAPAGTNATDATAMNAVIAVAAAALDGPEAGAPWSTAIPATATDVDAAAVTASRDQATAITFAERPGRNAMVSPARLAMSF